MRGLSEILTEFVIYTCRIGLPFTMKMYIMMRNTTLLAG